MSAFPRTLPLPTESGRTDRAVSLKITEPDTFQDTIRHYILPWTLVALADSYHAGSVSSQVVAEQSLHELLNRADKVTSEALKYSWVSAELLMSLNYLNSKLGQVAGPTESRLPY